MDEATIVAHGGDPLLWNLVRVKEHLDAVVYFLNKSGVPSEEVEERWEKVRSIVETLDFKIRRCEDGKEKP